MKPIGNRTIGLYVGTIDWVPIGMVFLVVKACRSSRGRGNRETA